MLLLILVLLILALTSCSTSPQLVGVQNSNDTLLLYTESKVIRIPLYDEQQNYFFKHGGDYHQVSYVCSGYSYGEHAKAPDYVMYNGYKYYVR